MNVMRLLEPNSKLATTCGLSATSADTICGNLLDLGEVSDGHLDAALDWLLRCQQHIERTLGRRHLRDGTLVLYDMSSSWCEGKQCPLANIGHLRDGCKKTLQIVF